MVAAHDVPVAPGEHRMLVGGKLVEAMSGRRFDNVNPATEQVLGQVADAGHEDMDEAIGAARRAFDETAWSTDQELRQRSLLQLQAALEDERKPCEPSWWPRREPPSCSPTDPSSTPRWPKA